MHQEVSHPIYLRPTHTYLKGDERVLPCRVVDRDKECAVVEEERPEEDGDEELNGQGDSKHRISHIYSAS